MSYSTSKEKMLQEESCLPSPPSCSRASALFPSVNRRPRIWGAAGVLGMDWGCAVFSLTAGSHKTERNAWSGQKLSRDAVPLTAMTCTGSGAAGATSAPSLPSGRATAGGSGAGSCGWGSWRPRQTVCRICK